MTTESLYIPGMCNINTKEVAYRRKSMWLGIGVSIAMFAVLLLLDVSWWLGIILLFIPVYIGAIGYLQVKNKFCVSYGSSGKQNADEGSPSAHDISDEYARKADRSKTRRMNLQALAITLAFVVACGLMFTLI